MLCPFLAFFSATNNATNKRQSTKGRGEESCPDLGGGDFCDLGSGMLATDSNDWNMQWPRENARVHYCQRQKSHDQ